MPLAIDPQLKAAIIAILADADLTAAVKGELIRALLALRQQRNENLVVEG